MIGKVLITALALAVGSSAGALAPPLPCDGEEGGMRIYGAWPFGHEASGIVVESYWNLDKDGVVGGADGPVPALNNFNGSRITECRSGRFLALDGIFQNDTDVLTATEFLRAKVQGEKGLSLREVETAARAVWGKTENTRILTMRETQETCGCRFYFPGLWK